MRYVLVSKLREATLSLLVWLAVSGQARAKPSDPGLQQILTYGVASAPAVTERLQANRSGLSNTPLPTNPQLEWQTQIADGITLGLLINRGGALLALSPNGKVTAIDRRGHRAWATALDAPPLSMGSLSNESRAVFISRSGRITSFDDEGRQRYTLFVGQAAHPTSAASLPHPSGGVLVSVDTEVSWIDDDGEILAQTSLERPPIALLLDEHDNLILVSDDGSVFRWGFHGLARKIGNLGRNATSFALARGTLYAIVAKDRLIQFDLATGATLRNTSLSKSSNNAPLLLSSDGGARLIGSNGVITGYTVEGTEQSKIALGSDQLAAARAAGWELQFLPPISDTAGTTAVVAPGLPVTVALEDGTTREVANAACDNPVSLTPAAAERLILACATGAIWSISQAPESIQKPQLDAARPAAKPKPPERPVGD